MSSAFQMRCASGMVWDEEVSTQLSSVGYEIGRYNIENTAKHFTQNPHYANSDNPSIRFVRYFPDGIASDFKNNCAFFWDAKIGTSIERNAYETYLEFNVNGREFYLFIKNGTSIYCTPLLEVCFLNSYTYVSQFREKNRMPIDDDGWIAPRLWNEAKYLNWKYTHPNASGTPFRYFDFDSMKNWRITWPFDYLKLKEAIEINKWKINPNQTQQRLFWGVTA